jgi:hypothetical protein
MARPRLTVEQILTWADAYHRRTGRWPRTTSGPVPEAPGENWNAISAALRQARRGLARFSTLARLLERERGVPGGLDRTWTGAEARRQEAVRLRRQGLNMRQTAARLGVRPRAVSAMLKKADREG